MRTFARVLILAAALAAPAYAGLPNGNAYASVTYESAYTLEQTFGTALRLVRVDLGCKVTEKDLDSGYLLFDYTSSESGKRSHRGAIEVVRAKRGSHVSVQLPTLPHYHEQMIADALAKKLLAEHGDPPHNKPPPVSRSEDAGAVDAGGP